MAARKKVAIIGSGCSGLGAARRLQKSGADVTVFDKGRALGGRLATRWLRDDDGSQGTAFWNHGAPCFSIPIREPMLRGYKVPKRFLAADVDDEFDVDNDRIRADRQFAEMVEAELLPSIVPVAYVEAARFMQEACQAQQMQLIAGSREEVAFTPHGYVDRKHSNPWSFVRPQMRLESRNIKDHRLPSLHFVPWSNVTPALYKPTPMSAVMAWAWSDMNVKQQHSVTNIEQIGDKYLLTVSVNGQQAPVSFGDYDAVIVAIPGPQAHPLLTPHMTTHDKLNDLERLHAAYNPVATAMVLTDKPEDKYMHASHDQEPEFDFNHFGRVTKKPSQHKIAKMNVSEATDGKTLQWTMHASIKASEPCMALTKEEIAARLVADAQQEFTNTSDMFSSAPLKMGHRWRYGQASNPLPAVVDEATVRKSILREVYFEGQSVGHVRADPEVVPLWKSHVVKPGLVVAGDYLSGAYAADGFVSGDAAGHQVLQHLQL